MSRWPGKYVIGITGNIGTGKSVVRRMLEHLGAFGIDADVLGHRAIAKGETGYELVLETFGRYLLTPEGQIDRSKLGRLVFNDPDAMLVLESIVHPLVLDRVDLLVRRATQKAAAIEAIKLFETDLANMCDSLWVVHAAPEAQLNRLMHNRRMTEADANQRIISQPPQESRFDRAAVIIRNDGDIQETWRQVINAWQRFVPVKPVGVFPVIQTEKLTIGDAQVQPVGLQQIDDLVNAFNLLYSGEDAYSAKDLMAVLAAKKFLLLKVNEKPRGILGWQAENQVALITDLEILSDYSPEQCLPVLTRAVERSASELQCEVLLVFAPAWLARFTSTWDSLGYTERKAEELEWPAWREAARSSTPPDAVLYVKRLEQDRISRPF